MATEATKADSKPTSNDGLNQYEAERMKDYDTAAKIVRENGWQCGGNAGIPELNPDGSEKLPEAAEAKGDNTDK